MDGQRATAARTCSVIEATALESAFAHESIDEPCSAISSPNSPLQGLTLAVCQSGANFGGIPRPGQTV